MIEKFEDYEYVCSECGGYGYRVISDITEVESLSLYEPNILCRTIKYSSEPCSKCNGKGKKDWLELIKNE